MRRFYLLFLFMVMSQIVFGKTVELRNKSPLDVEKDLSLPRQIMTIAFAGGPAMVSKELQGLTSILADMLNEGPTDLDGEAYRKKLFLLNGSIFFSGSTRVMYLYIKVPPQNLKEALSLANRVIVHPKLDSQTFERSKEKMLVNAGMREDDMQTMTFYYAMRNSFGYHPDTLDGNGSKQSLKNVNMEKVKEFYPKLFNTKHAFYSTVGPLESDPLSAMINDAFLSGDANSVYEKVKFESIDAEKFKKKEMKVTLINRPGANDNQILFLMPETIQQDGSEKVVGQITHDMLGGGLTGRLNKTLREKRGLTYHAGSFMGNVLPVWAVWTFGGTEQVSGLLSGIPEVVQSYKKEKLSKTEIKESKEKLMTSFKTDMELPEDSLDKRLSYQLFDRNPEFLNQYPTLLGQIQPKAIQNFISQKLNLQSAHLYLMGDKSQLLPILVKNGFPSESIAIVEVGEIL